MEIPKLCESVKSVPLGAAHRRWTLRADNNGHFHAVVRMSESPLYLELRWCPTARESVRPVGVFRLDLAALLSEGYIRSEPAGSTGPDLRLRIVRTDGGSFYVQPNLRGPRLLMEGGTPLPLQAALDRPGILQIGAKSSIDRGSLEHAIIIATEAHAGQVDKAGASYILHPLRVMLRMSTVDDRVVAVLHDVVEDSCWSLDQLRGEGFSEQIVRAIDSVTSRGGESYEEFVCRAGRNPIGRRVKLADLEENCDLTRIAAPTDKDHARIEKYSRAIKHLRANPVSPADEGAPEL